MPPNFVAGYLDNPAPTYPPISRHLQESGKVLLRVHVGVDGHGDRFEISQGSGYERLDQAALDAVRRWRFVPAHQGDTALAAWVLIPINFQLDR
jgi:protein TonB